MSDHLATALLPVAAAALLAPLAGAQSAADSFKPHSLTAFDHRTRLDVFADTNGDGQDELVSTWQTYANSESTRITYLHDIPSSLQRWTDTTLLELGSGGPHFDEGAHDVVAGDLTGDGREEVVLYVGHALRVYGSDGWAPVRLLQHDFGPHSVAGVAEALAVDFDGDGMDDLVLVDDGQARLLRSSLDGGGGLVLTETDTLSSQRSPVRLAAMDVRGSSVPELVLLVDAPLPTLWTIDIEGGAFGDAVRADVRATAGGQRIDLAPGDLDGDGDIDAVLFGHDGSYQVVTNDGGALSIGNPLVGGPATKLADWDGDGDLDGICCGGGGTSILNTSPSEFHICANLGGEVFEPAVVFPSIGGVEVLGVVDYDHDGDLDVLGGRSVLFNRARLGHAYCPGNPNSTGLPGRIEATGSASASVGTLGIVARDLPPNVTCLLVGGFAYSANNTPLWDGRFCLNHNVTRLGIVSSDGAGVADCGGPAGWWPDPFHMGTVPDTSYGFQVWHRDSPAVGTGANITSAVRVIVLE